MTRVTRSQQVLPTHSDSLADTTWAPPAQSSMRASAHLASHGAALSRNGGSSASLSLRPRTPGGRAKCRPRTAVRKFSLRGGARLALLCGRARHRQGASARFSAALRVVAFPYPVWQRCMARLAPAACLKPGQAQARMRSRSSVGGSSGLLHACRLSHANQCEMSSFALRNMRNAKCPKCEYTFLIV